LTGPLDPDRHRAVSTRLRAAGCVFAEDEARLLMEASPTSVGLDRLVDRRCAGEPLEVLLGWAAFRGLKVAVSAGVFVPRRRTELMVDVASDLAREGAVVVDLCTGSGAVALALSVERPDLELYAADLHPAALGCARANLLDRAQVVVSDLFAGLPSDLRGRIEVATANVPYVPTGELDLLPPEARDHEPRSTLDGGEDGLDVVRRVAREARDWLAPGGHLVVEVNRRQVASARFAVATAGLRPSVAGEDEDGTVFLAASSG
jgi:release factor glutamine methyltransferase